MPPFRLRSWLPFAAFAALLACKPSRPHAAEVRSNSTPPPVTSAPAVAGPTKDGGRPTIPERILTDVELTEDVRNANGATLALFSRALEPGKNGMVSGTSVRHAVGAAYYGAVGVTAREIAGALMLDDDRDLAASLARRELAAWQDARGKAGLEIATRLWLNERLSIVPEFQRVAESSFGAPAETVSYAKPEEARATINTWVSDKTHDKIPELLAPGSVDPSTRLVITNAIWFKGSWQFPFPKDATKDEPFKVAPNKTVTSPMMHLTDSFGFVADDGVKVLELRYADSDLAMLVVLPDAPDGLAKVASNLDLAKLDRWTSTLRTKRVNVTLPRFEFRSGSVLNGALQQLGMKQAFTDEADFSELVRPSEDKLLISDVVHQTYIAVDELGTEAAAATGVVLRTTSIISGPTADFRADHPFLFFVRDVKRGRVLFAGRVVDPTA